jgi:hypothetical protein
MTEQLRYLRSLENETRHVTYDREKKSVGLFSPNMNACRGHHDEGLGRLVEQRKRSIRRDAVSRLYGHIAVIEDHCCIDAQNKYLRSLAVLRPKGKCARKINLASQFIT